MLQIRRSILGRIKLHPLLSTVACHEPFIAHSIPVRRIHQLHLPSVIAAAGPSGARGVLAPQLLSMQVPTLTHGYCTNASQQQQTPLFLPSLLLQEYEKQRRALGELRRPLLKQVCPKTLNLFLCTCIS